MVKFTSYLLEIENNKERRINIGCLGKLNFKKGFYIYVGSAKKNLLSRIRRHFSKEKKIFWHIDYFLKEEGVEIKKVWKASLEECKIAGVLSLWGRAIKNFGSSDCKCDGHLFYVDCKDFEIFLKKLNIEKVYPEERSKLSIS